jgi:hypothetical protein
MTSADGIVVHALTKSVGHTINRSATFLRCNQGKKKTVTVVGKLSRQTVFRAIWTKFNRSSGRENFTISASFDLDRFRGFSSLSVRAYMLLNSSK